MALERHPIAVSLHGFEAVVPWTFAVQPMDMLRIISKQGDPAAQLLDMVVEFRKFLSKEELKNFDNHDVMEVSEIIGQWMERSASLREFMNVNGDEDEES